MRKNLAIVDDPASASRSAAIAGLQRMKQEQEVQQEKTAPTPMPPVLLADETGGIWELTINSKGVLLPAPYKAPQDGPATKL